MTAVKSSSTLIRYGGILISILLSMTTIIAAREELPASIILQMKGDAPQALLVTTTNDGGTATKVIKDLCGMDTYYVQTALVLEVKRTIDPTSTAIGVPKTGKVVQVCDNIEYNTYEREWVDESCSAPSEPGRKDEGWCGYIYLTPGPGTEEDPYNLAAGISSFEEVDSSVCETYLAENQCDGSEDKATTNGDGDESANNSASGRNRMVSFGSFVVAAFYCFIVGYFNM